MHAVNRADVSRHGRELSRQHGGKQDAATQTAAATQHNNAQQHTCAKRATRFQWQLYCVFGKLQEQWAAATQRFTAT